VRVVDYGLSRFTDATMGAMTSPRGTDHYKSPELLELGGEVYTERIGPLRKPADVYAFAMLCIEVISFIPCQ
jgi:serine/threonine protein kinase